MLKRIYEKLLCFVGALFQPKTVHYINGSEALPPPLKKEEEEEYFDDYDPELLDEFCRIESIDKKERQIKILIEDYEEYHFNNYQDFEHSIILRYYDEDNYTY